MAPELKNLAEACDAYYPNTPHGRQVWRQRLAEMEQWLAKADDAVAKDKPFPYPQPFMPAPHSRDLCGFYNGEIAPLKHLAIKGVVWYQGESDSRNRLWAIELKLMTQTWRALFSVKPSGQDIPFYWFQIQRSGDYCSPLIRQQQLDAMKMIPNSGMAVLLDLDVAVHPQNKTAAGERAALWALNRDYGRRDVVPSGPLYKSSRVEGNKIIISFDYTQGGLRLGSKTIFKPADLTDAKEVPNVEVAGKDRRWHKAEARIEGDTVVARSDKVEHPLYVRYCYRNIPDPPFLYNGAGLPAATFTTLEN